MSAGATETTGFASQPRYALLLNGGSGACVPVRVRAVPERVGVQSCHVRRRRRW